MDKETFKWQFGHFILYVVPFVCGGLLVPRTSSATRMIVDVFFFSPDEKKTRAHSYWGQLQKILINEVSEFIKKIMAIEKDTEHHRQIDQTRYGCLIYIVILNHHRPKKKRWESKWKQDKKRNEYATVNFDTLNTQSNLRTKRHIEKEIKENLTNNETHYTILISTNFLCTDKHTIWNSFCFDWWCFVTNLISEYVEVEPDKVLALKRWTD